MNTKKVTFILLLSLSLSSRLIAQEVNLRQKEYTSCSENDAIKWQSEVRSHLFSLLKMDDLIADNEKPDLISSVLKTEDR